MRLPDAEHERLAQLAGRILENDPTLNRFETVGRAVTPGLDEGPALLFEDHSEITLFSCVEDEPLQYRSLLLAGDDDLVVIRTRRNLPFEGYCRDILALGDAEVMVLPLDHGRPPLPRHCADRSASFSAIVKTARRHGRLNVMPYMGTESAWQLAGRIAAESGARIRVAAPPPNLTQRVNDKLWFARCVTRVLSSEARPPSFHASGPSAAARRVAALARRAERVVIKVPDSAGSAGNLVLDAAAVRALPLPKLQHQILGLLHSRGWRSRFPLLVGVWDCAVLSSPSVQLWIPLPDDGLPVVEGIFDQIVQGHRAEFIGATPCGLPAPLRQRLASEATQLALLFQQLGYFGRCSFDAIVSGTDISAASLRWIECNGRWGGTSIPMTLANRLLGDWARRAMLIVQLSSIEHRGWDLPDALERLGSLVYRPGGDDGGAIVLTPGRLKEGTGLHFLLLGRDSCDVERQRSEVEAAFAETGEGAVRERDRPVGNAQPQRAQTNDRAGDSAATPSGGRPADADRLQRLPCRADGADRFGFL